LIFAYFHGCDPIALNQVETPDQLSIVLAVNVLGSIPGMPGLFLSTIFSATLSTLSSGLNSIVAVLWEDCLKNHYDKKEKSVKAQYLMKLIVVLVGIITTCMAFACKLLGGIFQVVVATLGATSGPIAGLFFLGVFIPKANRNGAIVGFFVSSISMVTISVLYNLEKPYQDYVLSMEAQNNVSPACPANQNYSSIISDYYWNKLPSNHYGSIDSMLISRFSPFAYSITGLFF
jgi:sodium-coupled monocarboxylate transporter 8/12